MVLAVLRPVVPGPTQKNGENFRHEVGLYPVLAMKRTALRRVSTVHRVRLEIDELARTLMMTRHGAFLIDGTKRTWYGKCLKCGRTQYLQWCHVFTRGCEGVRWDPDNAWPGCHPCHDLWWHKRVHDIGIEPHEWWKQQIGEQRYETLRLRALTSKNPDRKAWKIKLQAELKEIQGNVI